MWARPADDSPLFFVWIELVCGYGSFRVGRSEVRSWFALHRTWGSQEIDSGRELVLPVVLWVFDNLALLERAGWRLLVPGAVDTSFP